MTPLADEMRTCGTPFGGTMFLACATPLPEEDMDIDEPIGCRILTIPGVAMGDGPVRWVRGILRATG